MSVISALRTAYAAPNFFRWPQSDGRIMYVARLAAVSADKVPCVILLARSDAGFVQGISKIDFSALYIKEVDIAQLPEVAKRAGQVAINTQDVPELTAIRAVQGEITPVGNQFNIRFTFPQYPGLVAVLTVRNRGLVFGMNFTLGSLLAQQNVSLAGF
jgi:hypothetical protein